MPTELEREKRARYHEVQALRAKLLQQELKIQAAEENAMKEEATQAGRRADQQLDESNRELQRQTS